MHILYSFSTYDWNSDMLKQEAFCCYPCVPLPKPIRISMPASVHGEEECCAIRHRKDLLQQEALTSDAGPARRNAAWIPGKPFPTE